MRTAICTLGLLVVLPLSSCGGGTSSAPPPSDSGAPADTAVSESDLTMEPRCDDRARNGNETDTDCGGTCPGCSEGKMCLADNDCASMTCTDRTCTPSCTDNRLDGQETDQDCGGPDCPKCADGKVCKAPSDCIAKLCLRGRCGLEGPLTLGFGPSTAYHPELACSSARIFIADFNGDAKNDVATTCSEALVVLKGKGDGTLGDALTFKVNGATAVADFNRDGLPDVPYPAGAGAFRVVIADLNGDGKPDLAVADGMANVNVLLNQGPGTFVAPVAYAAPGGGSVVAADFNVDGKLDLAVGTSILLNKGNGILAAAVNYPVSAGGSGVAASDVSGDGILDLVFLASGTIIGVLPGKGAGVFGSSVEFSVGQYGGPSVALADFNGDGLTDVATSFVNVLLNRGLSCTQ